MISTDKYFKYTFDLEKTSMVFYSYFIWVISSFPDDFAGVLTYNPEISEEAADYHVIRRSNSTWTGQISISVII